MTDILTLDSLSYTLRITLLPRVLRPQLAFARPRFRLRHTSCGNAYTWNGGLGRSEYACHESGITWPCILEDCGIRRYSGYGYECCQSGVEFHFLRPRCWGHCTSCTSLRGGSASESRHTSKFPAIIQARYKTRGLTSNIYSFAFTSEEAGLHTEYDSVSTEDIPANELERCSVIQILSGLGGCDHSRPVSSSSHVLFAGLGLTIFCDERGV